MAKILVLYYSSYGHIAAMAQAMAEGAGSVEGVEVTIKRVPETVPPEVRKQANFKEEPDVAVADPQELANYDAVIFGVPTRFGNMPGQMKNFLDQTGGLWARGALVGKVGSVFSSTATQHGGQESTILSTHTVLLHQGMIIVGLPYSFEGQSGVEAVKGGSPYGATTIAGSDGSRQPSAVELDGARYQGRHVAEITKKLHG